jgi:hypothetical protein
VTVRRVRNGQGLTAAQAFLPGRVITQITGRIVSPDTVWEIGGTFMDNCFRFGPETYLDPGDGAGRYLNHSCNPNAAVHKVGNRLLLVAVRQIRRGEEIVIDYSTTLGDDDIWTMRCRCGSAICRKTIRNLGSLPEAVRARYMERGMVPRYIVRTLREH